MVIQTKLIIIYRTSFEKMVTSWSRNVYLICSHTKSKWISSQHFSTFPCLNIFPK